MSAKYAKIRLNRDQLKEELKLPPQAEIMAATVLDTDLVLFIRHPQAPELDERGATPELTLGDIRCLGEY